MRVSRKVDSRILRFVKLNKAVGNRSFTLSTAAVYLIDNRIYSLCSAVFLDCNSEVVDGHKQVKIDIYFTGAGLVDLATVKEMLAIAEAAQK